MIDEREWEGEEGVDRGEWIIHSWHQDCILLAHVISFFSCYSCNDVKDLEELLVKYHSFDVGLKLYDTYESDNSILNNWIPQVLQY